MTVGRIYLGTEIDGAGIVITPGEKIRRVAEIREKLLKRFGGFTEYESTGWWRDIEGNHDHREGGIVFEVLINGEKKELLRKTAKKAGELLNQSAVIVTFQQIESTLIDCTK